ncbi:hypothetical protein BCR33DRAFT_730650 [Rhizoclosmatium globosum]|uniref:Serine hydrolase domain-containing protein n=1 Tax=Rhizoclosmatium globosum TaxID=329046 RepID=A0A1Y2ABW3_9FUNG|nr:hypothetical protein BCR33DRAFT_730650 [Rhizoclosmatium globosum]|eukprot:ORY19992.1 hypothetical protein BCR33DRAFT_730650 [Rhizoclosmatium globosum]
MKVMPDSVAPTKKRILCLHGLRTNASVMEFQITGLKLALGSEVDFISVNAPMIADADPEIVEVFGDAGPWYSWYKLALFGKYDGLDRQGAVMATIMTARMQHSIRDKSKYLWKGVILVCGPSVSNQSEFKKLQFPSIHIAGKEDVKGYDRSIALREQYEGKDRQCPFINNPMYDEISAAIRQMLE